MKISRIICESPPPSIGDPSLPHLSTFWGKPNQNRQASHANIFHCSINGHQGKAHCGHINQLWTWIYSHMALSCHIERLPHHKDRSLGWLEISLGLWRRSHVYNCVLMFLTHYAHAIGQLMIKIFLIDHGAWCWLVCSCWLESNMAVIGYNYSLMQETLRRITGAAWLTLPKRLHEPREAWMFHSPFSQQWIRDLIHGIGCLSIRH